MLLTVALHFPFTQDPLCSKTSLSGKNLRQLKTKILPIQLFGYAIREPSKAHTNQPNHKLGLVSYLFPLYLFPDT